MLYKSLCNYRILFHESCIKKKKEFYMFLRLLFACPDPESDSLGTLAILDLDVDPTPSPSLRLPLSMVTKVAAKPWRAFVAPRGGRQRIPTQKSQISQLKSSYLLK